MNKTTNENEFFRQAVLHICGNLRIEEAMCNCIGFIRDYIPVDEMYLLIYEPGLGAMRTLAKSTQEKGKLLNWLTAFPKDAQEKVKKNLTVDLDHALIIDPPEENPVSREMMRFSGIEGRSVLRMTLTTENGQLGQVALTAKGSKRYVERHAQLLTLLQKPFAIAMSNALKHREIIQLRDLLADDNRFLQSELHRLSGDEIIGANFGLKDVMHKAERVASMDSPVLLLGETGTGKDLIANRIHYSSNRGEGPFISVNCGAIPDNLIDSELFGHEKGAFTGALSKKRGRFERANKGTIFLDEIGELPPQAQVRLLRVLQNKEIERVGGSGSIQLDIRIIAATNRNLKKMVEDKLFREDLWFRLNVFPIHIPPLRERTVDIPALIQHLVNLKAKEMKLPSIPELGTGVINMAMKYSWPGNVRELENLIERALILNPTGVLSFDLFNTPQQTQHNDIPEQAIETFNLDDLFTQHIKKVLKKTNGKINGPGGAAELLGINPNTLRNRMDNLGIEYGRSTKR